MRAPSKTTSKVQNSNTPFHILKFQFTPINIPRNNTETTEHNSIAVHFINNHHHTTKPKDKNFLEFKHTIQKSKNNPPRTNDLSQMGQLPFREIQLTSKDLLNKRKKISTLCV